MLDFPANIGSGFHAMLTVLSAIRFCSLSKRLFN
jgi:hypothetical protein